MQVSLQVSNVNEVLSESDRASISPTSAQRALANAEDEHKRTQGFDLKEIQAVNLKQFRTSDLPGLHYLLLLLPVIGWIMLACFKYQYVSHHREAEDIMETFDSKGTIDEKIAIISEAIKVSGPHAWQYRLELARLHLSNGKYREAATELAAVKEQRGSPTQSGHYNVRNKDIVSFKAAGAPWADGKNVIQITYHTGYEALIHAAVFAANQQYVDAYDAYNEVMYYNNSLSNIRKHQKELVIIMKSDPSILGARGKEIIAGEK